MVSDLYDYWENFGRLLSKHVSKYIYVWIAIELLLQHRTQPWYVYCNMKKRLFRGHTTLVSYRWKFTTVDFDTCRDVIYIYQQSSLVGHFDDWNYTWFRDIYLKECLANLCTLLGNAYFWECLHFYVLYRKVYRKWPLTDIYSLLNIYLKFL